jgi:hypothetical protein
VEDPLEVFIAALYDIVKHDNQEKSNLRGKGRTLLARRSDSLRRQATISLSRSASSDSVISATSETLHERRASQQHSRVNAVEAVLHPHGHSDPPTVSNTLRRVDSFRELTGSEMALMDDPKDVKNALRHSRVRSESMHDVKLYGPIDIRDVGFEKLTILPTDLYEFVSTQYDFHIRLQTEVFNWTVFAQKVSAQMQQSDYDSDAMSEGNVSVSSTGSIKGSTLVSHARSKGDGNYASPSVTEHISPKPKRGKGGINDRVKSEIAEMMRSVF